MRAHFVREKFSPDAVGGAWWYLVWDVADHFVMGGSRACGLGVFAFGSLGLSINRGKRFHHFKSQGIKRSPIFG